MANTLLALWTVSAIGLTFGKEERTSSAQAPTSTRCLLQRETREEVVDRKWNPPHFFDAFSSGESTWEYDAAQTQRATDMKFHDYADGYSPPDVANPFDPHEVEPVMFHESESFGPEQALQTDWPQPLRGPAGHNNQNGPWYQDSNGEYIQAYEYQRKGKQQSDAVAGSGNLFYAAQSSGAKTADWFDSSVNQFDNYGRPKNPYPDNPVRLESLGYVQQDVNTSVSCKEAGCNASSLLRVISPGKNVQSCKLTVLVKPTDFGEGKIVELISVNGVNVSVGCQPSSSALATGECSKKEASELSHLYTCVQDVDVLHLLGSEGTLTVTAKISPTVAKSDCAYQGNLLYAIPRVSCLVGEPSAKGNLSSLGDLPRATPRNMSLELGNLSELEQEVLDSTVTASSKASNTLEAA